MDEHVYPNEKEREHFQQDSANQCQRWPGTEAIKARARDIARRHAAARSLLAKAESALEQGRQAVGEALARQRWIEEESRRGSLARERQATLRADEDCSR